MSNSAFRWPNGKGEKTYRSRMDSLTAIGLRPIAGQWSFEGKTPFRWPSSGPRNGHLNEGDHG